ncbi:hypothetical protein EVJ30_14635 [Exiguobacterium sp. SH5S13]|uniref:hypothetical protein n=1 Tax=Exiguobacterium sp. SH5S13 TaxID=2510959 RepID=UPI00103BBD0D|nr:hypothetical protein [Exiguobacterium sp. SH5S13]TCI49560.1 hypothetical protein EVJ30_14635 [Exiguobacterium sp. SH5S13]
MTRIKIGDVFKINTPNGEAYLQYVHEDKTIGELVRILPGVYEKPPENLKEIVSGKEAYLLHCSLKPAKRQKIIEAISNYDIPPDFKIPRKFRTEITDDEGNLIGWHIVDYVTWYNDVVYELTEEQIQLSPWDTWSYPLLVERVSEGWTLENWK